MAKCSVIVLPLLMSSREAFLRRLNSSFLVYVWYIDLKDWVAINEYDRLNVYQSGLGELLL
jgi:hypothetical protein